MTAIVLNIEAIVSDPEIRGGRPIIEGTTLCVSDVVAYYLYDGMRPEELATAYKISLGQVHAALAYYFMHQAEIDDEMQAGLAIAEASAQKLAKEGRLIRFG